MSPASAAYYEFELPEGFDEWLAQKRKENPNFARCTLAPMAAMQGHPYEAKTPGGAEAADRAGDVTVTNASTRE